MIKFSSIIEYSKAIALSFAIVLKKILTFFHKTHLTSTIPQINLKSKITKFYTGTTNKCFIIIIVILCLVTIVFSYYEQHYKFKQQLINKAEFAHSRIQETVEGYLQSLESLAKAMTRNDHHLEPKKALQLLKFFYIFDDDLKLLPVTWHPSDDFNKSFSTFGIEIVETNENLLKQLKQKPYQVIIYDQPSILSDFNLIIVFPVLKQNKHSDSTKENNLIGYLKASIKAPLIMQTLYDNLSADNLLKITRQKDNAVIYFAKQETRQHNPFKVVSYPSLENYQFSKDINFSNIPYKIAVAQDTKQILTSSFKIASLRCGIILVICGVMLFTYNYIERKKVKKLFQDNQPLVEEITSLQQQLQDSSLQSEISSKKAEILTKQLDTYIDSNKVITKLERQIKQGYNASLHKIQDYLFVNHYTKEELTPDVIKEIFANVFKISEDLIDNISNRGDCLNEIDIDSIFIESLSIFNSIIEMRSIKIIKNIDQIKIYINEIIFKQVLISLLARSLYLISNNRSITISAIKDPIQNAIIIEIIDNGFGFNESVFKNIEQQNNKGILMLAGVTQLQPELKAIEKTVKKILAGDIKIVETYQGNHITLMLPLKEDKADKVIYISKIVAR